MRLARRNFCAWQRAVARGVLPRAKAYAVDAAKDPKAAAHPHWSYGGKGGPEHWGELQPDFKVCQLGLEQTPIDLSGAMKGEAGAVSLDYKPLPLRIVNNGHTIQVNADSGCSCSIAGAKYDLLQFHFHHPSEHLLAGKPFDLECHFVHKSSAGALAVVGVFIRPGARNAALAPLFDAMPAKEGPEVKAAGAHRSGGAAAEVGRIFPLHGLADHAALLGRPDLDRVQGTDRSVTRPDQAIRVAVLQQRAAGAEAQSPLSH